MTKCFPRSGRAYVLPRKRGAKMTCLWACVTCGCRSAHICKAMKHERPITTETRHLPPSSPCRGYLCQQEGCVGGVHGRLRKSALLRKWGRGEILQCWMNGWSFSSQDLKPSCGFLKLPLALTRKKKSKKKWYSGWHIFIPPLHSHFTWAADALIVLALQGSLFTCSW